LVKYNNCCNLSSHKLFNEREGEEVGSLVSESGFFVLVDSIKRVGESDGFAMGWIDGFDVGSVEGFEPGEFDGITVGDEVGKQTGCIEGFKDGNESGC